MSTTVETKTISICKEGRNCPYLNGNSVFQILAEKDYWQRTAEKRKRKKTNPTKKEGHRLVITEKGEKDPRRLTNILISGLLNVINVVARISLV